jgi:hypothetical protein
MTTTLNKGVLPVVTAAVLRAVLLFALSSCTLFATREPEPPMSDRGTFLQPDTPDRVIENIRFAVGERNTRNYRRSLSDDLTFDPTATAQSQHPIWTGWTAGEEESYFASLVSAVAEAANMSLELNDVTLTAIDAEHFAFDATYVITAEHNRQDIPVVFQGRLAWQLAQQVDGLWALESWVDREVGSEPSWSDLKAAFTG